MKLVGVSGPQGAGKSTILSGMVDMGIFVDDFKVSRSVQAQFGWDTLDRVKDNVSDMIAFQEAIIKQKHTNDVRLRETNHNLVITERTYADIYAYARLWSWIFVDKGAWTLSQAASWLMSIYPMLIEYQQLYDGLIYVPYAAHIKWEQDPNRADIKDVSFIETELQCFLFGGKRQLNAIKAPVLTITGITPAERVHESLAWLKEL